MKREVVTAAWIAVLMSSVVLAELHWAAATAAIGLGAIGTMSMVFDVRTGA